MAGCGAVCYEADPESNLAYVGSGQGSCMQVSNMEMVGKGRGDYEKEKVTSRSAKGRLGHGETWSHGQKSMPSMPINWAFLRMVTGVAGGKALSQMFDQFCRHQLHTLPGMAKVVSVVPDAGASLDSDGKVERLDQRLLKAAEEGRQEEVKELLHSNANIEAKGGEWRETPLHFACEKGHRDIVDLLLEKKAQIEATNADQETPLHFAAYFDRKEVVTLLLEKGADPGAQGCDGNLALSYILDRSLGLESFGRLLAEKNLWSRSVLVAIIKLDNQDSILNLLKSWPQNAWTGTGFVKTELKRASVPERLRTVLAPPSPLKGEEIYRLNESDAEFSAQNFFWAQKVPVTLKHLPGVWGSDAVNEDFLKTLADCPHDGIFETDAVQAMVLAAWQQYRAFTLLEIVSGCLTVICLCWASYGFRHGFALSTPPFYVVAALHLKKSLDESIQAFPHLVQFFKCSANQGSYMTFDNAADALYLVGGWLAIERQLFIGSDELEKPWMAVFAAAAWLRLLYSLRAETWMGPRLLPILSALKDTFAFFLLMLICIASAAHAYYNLQVREEPTPTYAALMQVVRLGVFGDFDLFEFEGLDPTYRLKDDGIDNESQNEWEPIDPSPGPDYAYVHVLFYVTGVGITVLLMNVLIGVLSSNYERYEAQSVGQFFRARVKMLVEIQGRPLGRIVGHIFNFRRGGPYRWLFVCLRGFCRIVFFTLFIACLPCMLIMFLVCLLFFRGQGMMCAILCSLGRFGNDLLPASECHIFLVVRDEPDGNEVRSVRTALESKIEKIETKLERRHQDLESKIEKVEAKLESKIEKVEHTMSQIHELLREVTRTGRGNSEASPQVERDRHSETATETRHVLLVPGLQVETQSVTTQATKPTRTIRGIYFTLSQQRGVWFSPVRSLFDVAPAVIGAKLRPAAQAPGDLDESTRGRLALQWQVVVPYAMRRIQSLLW
eukprot:symbB.v1.2.035591.t2/scaffold4833.1/size34140/4